MVTFTEDCIIGIEEIDNEHRHLFDLINQGMDMLENHGDSYDEIKTLVMELEDYAQVHFEHEESYMEQICDQELINQRVQHAIFRNRVRTWSFTEIESVEEQKRLMREMMEYMTKWLYNHIIGSDIMIGKLPPVEEWMLKENPCEFTEEYMTGIPLVDAEHRELFRLVGQANEMVRLGIDESDFDQIKKILEGLKTYSEEHFRDEEEYMESIQYAGLEAQKRAHCAFMNKLQELDFEKIQRNTQGNLEKLVEFLMQWLINHILYLDKKITAS